MKKLFFVVLVPIIIFLFQTQASAEGACTITSFTRSPEVVVPGGSSTISWTTTGCDSVSFNIAGDPSIVRPANGSMNTGPLTTTTRYGITAVGPNNSATVSNTGPIYPVQVTVRAQSITVLSPNVSAKYQGGQTVDVKWKVAGISSTAMLSVGIISTNSETYYMGSVPAGGAGGSSISLPFPKYPKQGSYKLQIQFYDNTDTLIASDVSDQSFTIIPLPYPDYGTCTIDSFTADPNPIPYAGASTLSWTTTGCNSVFINRGEGSTNLLSPDGSLSTASTLPGNMPTYTLMASAVPQCWGTPTASGTGQPCNYASKSVVVTMLPSTTPIITLFVPNGNETFRVGEEVKIEWAASNQPTPGHIGLALVDENNFSHYIFSDVSIATRAYEWKIPSSVVPGKYKIRVFCGKDNSEAYCDSRATSEDMSEEYFTILAAADTTTCTTIPYIKLLSPNGGETYQAGQQLTVTWKNCNVPTDKNVWIGLRKTNGTLIYLTSDPNVPTISTANDGTETFTIPTSEYSGITSGTYTVSVTSSVAVAADDSDAPFTITTSNGTLPPGCTSTAGYSNFNGQPCNLPYGCLSAAGYSYVTGEPCNGTGGRPAAPTTTTPTTSTASTGEKFTFTKRLMVGSKGIDVVVLQSRLKSEGVYTGSSDGKFGPMTREAVKRFQTKYGLPAVGNVGPMTLQLLNK